MLSYQVEKDISLSKLIHWIWIHILYYLGPNIVSKDLLFKNKGYRDSKILWHQCFLDTWIVLFYFSPKTTLNKPINQ